MDLNKHHGTEDFLCSLKKSKDVYS